MVLRSHRFCNLTDYLFTCVAMLMAHALGTGGKTRRLYYPYMAYSAIANCYSHSYRHFTCVITDFSMYQDFWGTEAVIALYRGPKMS